MPTIRVRLRVIAGLVSASLRRASLVNLVAIGLLLVAAFGIHWINGRANEAFRLALLAETQRGLVSRVVAEMDLARQAEIRSRFVATSDELSSRAAAANLEIDQDLASARKNGDLIFGFAASFAQQQALSVSDGPFAEATRKIQNGILEMTERADRTASRAMTGMWVLGIGALALQHYLGRLSQRRLAGLMDNLADGLSADIEHCAGRAERIAGGDIEVRPWSNPGGTEESDRLQRALVSMEIRLKGILGDIQSATQTLSRGAEEVSTSAHALSLGTARQAASMEQTTATMNQMASSISQNTELIRLTEGFASQNVVGARNGSESMRETAVAMRQVIEKASIIEDVANRTNLLSLNAAIEAARAGEHGRGFSVIASEVRSLSHKSSAALNEIRTVAESSIAIAERAASLINNLVPTSEKTAAAANRVLASSIEQMEAAREIGRAVLEIDGVTQSTAASSQQLAATAEAINGQAQRLRETAAFFRVATSGSSAG
jgi:methyl-accepting chemotaxis protein